MVSAAQKGINIMQLPGVHQILFGGDYNPEQWPEDTWEGDMKLFREAHVTELTLNVFSWALLQPSEEVYDFSRLDKIMDLAEKNGIRVILATSTAAQPAWMSTRYPETNKVDEWGHRHKFGGRQNICPTSRIFRHYAFRLAGKLAERYGGRKNLAAWHVSNEYGGYCYCDQCQQAYREWLRERYGTLEELNRAWNTSFWGHTVYDWNEIVLPDMLSEEFNYMGDPSMRRTNVQGNSIDFRRFSTDRILDLYDGEKKAIREYSDAPITTNLMYNFDGFDLAKIARHCDFVSWDNYPNYGDHIANTAMWHDVCRGIGGGKSFSLMEQTPGVSNWHLYCRLKRPGVMRLWSYQAVAHGADTVLFFQMKRSIGECEKYHSALIDHVGTDNTRVFREMTALGKELEGLGDALLGAESEAKAAILIDWDNWWGTELSAGPTIRLKYLEELQTWYRYFYTRNVPVDFVTVDEVLGGFDNCRDAVRQESGARGRAGAGVLGRYRLVLAPQMYMNRRGFDEAVRGYVKAGGRFVTSYFSGYVDDNDLVLPGGYPGRWKDFLGVWVEESDALPPDQRNCMTYDGVEYPCDILCDLMHETDGDTKVLASYGKDFYREMPAVTRHPFGKGCAWYVGTRSSEEFYLRFLDDLCQEADIRPLAEGPADVEVTARHGKGGRFLFFLNHADEERSLTAPVSGTELLSGRKISAGERIDLAPKDVFIVRAQEC